MQSGPFVPKTVYNAKVLFVYKDVAQVALVTRDGTDFESRRVSIKSNPTQDHFSAIL